MRSEDHEAQISHRYTIRTAFVTTVAACRWVGVVLTPPPTLTSGKEKYTCVMPHDVAHAQGQPHATYSTYKCGARTITMPRQSYTQVTLPHALTNQPNCARG